MAQITLFLTKKGRPKAALSFAAMLRLVHFET